MILNVLIIHTHSHNYEVLDILISFTVGPISQCICILKEHVVCLKYIPFLFVKHTSIKLKKKKTEIYYEAHTCIEHLLGVVK